MIIQSSCLGGVLETLCGGAMVAYSCRSWILRQPLSAAVLQSHGDDLLCADYGSNNSFALWADHELGLSISERGTDVPGWVFTLGYCFGAVRDMLKLG